MKKLTLLAAFALTATMAFGQGTVNFANDSASLITTNRNMTAPTASGNMRGSGQWTIGLFVGPSGTTSFNSMQPVAYANNSSVAAGRFSLGSVALPAPYDGTAPVAVQVRAWSTGLGTDWATVAGKVTGYAGTGNAAANFDFAAGTYFLGSSIIGSVTPGVPPLGIPATLFGTSAGQLSGFAMYEVIPIPEPSTLALLGLGLTGLLFIRRRK